MKKTRKKKLLINSEIQLLNYVKNLVTSHEEMKKSIQNRDQCVHSFGQWQLVELNEPNYFGTLNSGNMYLTRKEYQRKCNKCGMVEHAKEVNSNKLILNNSKKIK